MIQRLGYIRIAYEAYETNTHLPQTGTPPSPSYPETQSQKLSLHLMDPNEANQQTEAQVAVSHISERFNT